MKIIIYLLFVYLTIFTIYYTALVGSTFNKKRKRISDNYNKKLNNLCVVVYSHNNKETVENLIKQLKNQTYPSRNYTIQLVLDNCTDNSEMMFQGDLSVNVMNIKNVDTIGKDQAFSLITEKYSPIKDLDAYVFLDAQYYVNSDFLEKVNDSLQDNEVVSGAVTLICQDKLSLLDNIKYSYNQYKNYFISISRDALGFSNLVNSDILAIKKAVLDEIGSINIKDVNDELKYTVKLAGINVKTGFNPDVKIYINVSNYDSKIPSLSKRVGLFFENLVKIHPNNYNFSELIASLIYPNCITLILGFYILFNYAYYRGILNCYLVGFEIALLMIGFSASLLHAKIHAKEHLYLFLYPFYALCKVVYNFPPLRFIRKCLFKSEEVTQVEKLSVPVFVSDGERYYPCKLEIVSEANFTKVIFINKKKKYKTKNHIRVLDALKEISAKLESFGYTLRLCEGCKYFEPNIDGSINQINGFCKFPFSNRVKGDILPTVIWNACDAFEKVNVVNLFDVISSKKEDDRTK